MQRPLTREQQEAWERTLYGQHEQIRRAWTRLVQRLRVAVSRLLA